MRKPLLLIITAAALLSTTAIAQEKVDMAALTAAVETQRQMTEAQRQLVVSENLVLNGDESEKFWPLYRQYRADVAIINDRLVALIARFAENYAALGDDEAMALIKESQDIESDRLKLSKKYAKNLNKFMAGQNVLRLMQIESRLDAVIDLKLKNSIPLAH